MSCATVDITLNYLCKYWNFFCKVFLNPPFTSGHSFQDFNSGCGLDVYKLTQYYSSSAPMNDILKGYYFKN